MKKLLVLLVGLAVILSISAVAQDASKDMGKTDKAAAAPLKELKGTVKAEGDKTTFVDKEGKSWDVMNPEALKGHEGHEVAVKAHVYKDKGQIHVMSVKMMKEKDHTM
jgi:hypothetical protein